MLWYRIRANGQKRNCVVQCAIEKSKKDYFDIKKKNLRKTNSSRKTFSTKFTMFFYFYLAFDKHGCSY